MALPIENETALREFLMQQFSATPDSAGLEEALAADRQRTVDSQKAAMFSQAAALMRNEKVPTLQPQQSDSAFREWLMRQRVQDQGTERKLQAAGALAKLDRAPELDAQPAPPEWNALPGMTRSEALRAGYGRPAADKTGAPLTPEEVDEAARLRIAYDGRDPEKVRDDLYGERRSVRNADAQKEARSTATAAADEKVVRDADSARGRALADLRQEFMNQPVVKRTQEIAESAERILSSQPTGPGDIALLVSYMKMIDPGSTVREGEFATAENAGGVPESIRNTYNKVTEGTLLAESTRQKFREQAQSLLDAQLSRYDRLASEYGRLATEAGGKPDSVILNLGFRRSEKPKKVIERRRAKDGRILVKYEDGTIGEEGK